MIDIAETILNKLGVIVLEFWEEQREMPRSTVPMDVESSLGAVTCILLLIMSL